MSGGGGGGAVSVTGTSTTAASQPPWSRFHDKLFERGLVVFPEGTPNRWENIASQVPGMSPLDVWQHYEDLLHDVAYIDNGGVEPPIYMEDPSSSSSSSSRPRYGDAERKKGIPWTDEEHRLFLIGLQKYGKGDWRSISRNAVVTRTPTQVASHAQKYYLRLNSSKKENRRSSIHDIPASGSGGGGGEDDASGSGFHGLAPELTEIGIGFFSNDGSFFGGGGSSQEHPPPPPPPPGWFPQ